MYDYSASRLISVWGKKNKEESFSSLLPTEALFVSRASTQKSFVL